jgi:hypothetical protein
MSILDRISGGKGSSTNIPKEFKNMALGVVVTTGIIDTNPVESDKRRRDERFNADTHAIRVRIVGSQYDNDTTDDELPNCFPLLPKHLNFVPQKDELVLVFLGGKDEKHSDRFYIGPIVSREEKMGKDTADTTAASNYEIGIAQPAQQIERIPSAKGVYEDPFNVVIEGRNNTDVIQRENEVLIRAGKFKLNNRLSYNSKNPGYIQLKFNQKFNEQELDEFNIGNGTQKSDKPSFVTVTNVVSEKINLLTYDKGNTYGLTDKGDKDKGAAVYITDDEMNNILNNAHPLVFGDILLDYLKAFRNAFETHVHDGGRLIAEDKTDKPDPTPVGDFKAKAKDLETKMLSKNIRIN